MTDKHQLGMPPQWQHGQPVAEDFHVLPAGTRLGRYELRGTLGQGGFGITYRAHDTQLHRDVAVKEYMPTGFSVRRADGTVLARSTQAADIFLWGRERFIEEARTLARLEKAPSIVNVHDIIEAHGTAYMVMELASGQTLEARLKRDGRLYQPTIELLLYPLLDGLEQVHQANFLHRDIKPANILIDETGRPTLLDFGASRMALQGRTQAMTAVYTPGYAAFEQSTSARQGPWTDIYGLGATLYHCIEGNPPPNASDRMIDDRLVPAREVGKGRYAPSLLAAIDASLQLKPADRPQTIREVRGLLSGQSSIPVAPPAGAATGRSDQPGRSPDGGRRKRGSAAVAWALVVVLGASLAGAGVYVWQQEQEAAERRAIAAKAQAEKEEAARQAADAARRKAEEAARQAEAAARQKAEAERQKAEAERQKMEAERRLARQEDEAWARAKAANTAAAYREYLSAYPSGRFAAEAQRLADEAVRREQSRSGQELGYYCQIRRSNMIEGVCSVSPPRPVGAACSCSFGAGSASGVVTR